MKNILIVADQTGPSKLVLKRALSFVQNRKKAQGVKLTLVGFYHTNVKNAVGLFSTDMTADEFQRMVLHQRKRALNEMAKAFPKAFSIKVLSVWEKNIAKWIVDYVIQHKIDFVIKSGVRSESWFHTPTDWQLFKECSVPVMVVASKSWKKKARILVALDLNTTVASKNKLNDKLIAEGRELCEILQAELHCGCALEVPQIVADLDLINLKKFTAERKQKLKPIIADLCDKHEIDPAVVHIKQGEANRAIPSIANKIKADIVVVGSYGRKGIKGKLVGNTAEGILSKLYTDICVVKL